MHAPTSDSYNNSRQVRFVTWVGLIVNIILAMAKLIAGVMSHSRALVADAIHSLSDFGTDIAVLVGSHYWNQPPDKEHPYGHRRIETLISIGIGLALGTVGVLLILDAIESIQKPAGPPPGWVAAWVAIASILFKELLYRYTHHVGRQIKSMALTANAWHHRSDAVSSIPVLIAVLFSKIFPQLTFLDAIGAVVVGAFILRAAFQIAWPGISEVMDHGASLEVNNRLQTLAQSIPGVRGVHDLRTRYSGSALQVDLHIELRPDMSLLEAHTIGDQVRDALKQSDLHVLDVLVHLDPYNDHFDEIPPSERE